MEWLDWPVVAAYFLIVLGIAIGATLHRPRSRLWPGGTTMSPRHLPLCLSILTLTGVATGAAPGDEPPSPRFEGTPAEVGHVFPHMTVMADGVGSTSETGIAELIPWANRLWALGYVAHIQGSAIGLYEIGEDMSFRKHPASVTGTFANRLVHWESEQVRFLRPRAAVPVDAAAVVVPGLTLSEAAKRPLEAYLRAGGRSFSPRPTTSPRTSRSGLELMGRMLSSSMHTSHLAETICVTSSS